MAFVVGIHSLVVIAVFQMQTSEGTPSGFILLSCFENARENSSTGPCLLRGSSTVRRDDYSYTPGIGGHKLHTRAAPWNEARLTCEDEGGHLAIINSIAEANVLTEFFRNTEPMTGSANPDFVSIGFHDLFSEGQHTTIHSQSLAKAGFTQWALNQPDNGGGNENCGSFHKSGRLNDIDCAARFGFICELPIY